MCNFHRDAVFYSMLSMAVYVSLSTPRLEMIYLYRFKGLPRKLHKGGAGCVVKIAD